MKCTHSTQDPWAANRHRRRGEKPCPASLKAAAAYMRAYRVAVGLTTHRLVPIKEIGHR